MKIKHLLIGMLAIAGAVACNQVEPVEEPKLEVDKATVEVAATAGETSFNVTSNQNWVATADADWVSLEPASGAASEKAVTVKVTAEDNETTAAREATVTVKAGDLSKTVKVKQVAAGETPAPDHSEWALVGSFNEWSEGSELYLSVLDEEYFVYYGFELAANDEFKFLKGGAWPPAGTEIGGNGLVEPNTIQPAGGSNIKVTEAGKYDIYLAADLATFYVMSEGKLPSEAVEPAPVENQWSMMGCFVDNQWNTDVPMTKEGEWIVAKGAQFTELTFKIRANESWADATNIGLAPGSANGEINTKVSVVTAEYSKANLGGDAADIKLNGEAGTYDVYFSYENLELYVMTPGLKPGDTPVQPEPEPEPTPTPDALVAEVVMADYGWPNKYDYIDNEKFWINSDIAFRFRIGSSSTSPLYDAGDCSVHMFQNGSTLDVMSNEHTEYVETKFRITSIEITFASNQCTLTPDSGELSAEGEVRTWTGDATNVKFTASGTDKSHRAYVKAIKVYYEAL